MPGSDQPAAPAPASTGDKLHAANFSTCVLVLLTIVWSLGGHHAAKKVHFLTEGSAACALGLATGLALLLFHNTLSWSVVQQLLEFNAAGFFTYLLPPVIFYCGLSVEKAVFFANLPSILLAGVGGTLVSWALISTTLYALLGFTAFQLADCLAMGAIFAATDSVATLTVLDRRALPSLFSLVFGEGVINDAVSVVLLGAIRGLSDATAAAAKAGAGAAPALSGWAMAGWLGLRFVYLMTTSLALGAGAGLGIALLLKKLPLAGPHQEVALVGLLSYLSYLLADVAGWSGILSLFTCGLAVSHYALHNLSPEGREVTLGAFRVGAYLAEGLIFIYVGMDALDPLKWKASHALEALWLTLVLVALLAASRAAFVVPFVAAHNAWAPVRLSNRDTVIIWWAGLMRGAVSVALVYYYFDDSPGDMGNRQRSTLIVATLMVVVISILGCGALTKPLMARLLEGDPSRPLLAHLAELPSSLRHARSRSLGDGTGLGLYMAPLAAAAAAGGGGGGGGGGGVGGGGSGGGSRDGGRGGGSIRGWPSGSSLEGRGRQMGAGGSPSPRSLASRSGRWGQLQQQQQQQRGAEGDSGWPDWPAGVEADEEQALGRGRGAAAGGGERRGGAGEPLGGLSTQRLAPPPPAATGGSSTGLLLSIDSDPALHPSPTLTPASGGGGGAGMRPSASNSSMASGGQPAVLQHINELWSNFDQRVMQPVFGGPGRASSNNTPTHASGGGSAAFARSPGGSAASLPAAAAAAGGAGAGGGVHHQRSASSSSSQRGRQQQQQPWADPGGGL